MRLVLKQIGRRATSRPVEDPGSSTKAKSRHPSDELSSLLARVDELIGSSQGAAAPPSA